LGVGSSTGGFSCAATAAANAVVTGTAATIPMLPTSVRTISCATACDVRMFPIPTPEIDEYSSNGYAAPA
jgi:hypothetical protein